MEHVLSPSWVNHAALRGQAPADPRGELVHHNDQHQHDQNVREHGVELERLDGLVGGMEDWNP